MGSGRKIGGIKAKTKPNGTKLVYLSAIGGLVLAARAQVVILDNQSNKP